MHLDLMERAAQIVLQKQVKALLGSSQVTEMEHLHFDFVTEKSTKCIQSGGHELNKRE